MRDTTPTPKMVREAINWSGPWLRRKPRWWRSGGNCPGQLNTYVEVLREFAMQVTMHPDFMQRFVGFEDSENT